MSLPTGGLPTVFELETSIPVSSFLVLLVVFFAAVLLPQTLLAGIVQASCQGNGVAPPTNP